MNARLTRDYALNLYSENVQAKFLISQLVDEKDHIGLIDLLWDFAMTLKSVIMTCAIIAIAPTAFADTLSQSSQQNFAPHNTTVSVKTVKVHPIPTRLNEHPAYNQGAYLSLSDRAEVHKNLENKPEIIKGRARTYNGYAPSRVVRRIGTVNRTEVPLVERKIMSVPVHYHGKYDCHSAH